MDQFPSNSQSARRVPNAAAPTEEAPAPVNDPAKLVVEPVVTGKVTRRKKSMLHRVSDTLFKGQTSVLGYLLEEVVIPGVKEVATAIVTQGIEKALYGEVRSPRGGARGNGYYSYGGVTSRTHTSYDRPAARPATAPPRRPVQRSSAMVDDVVVDTMAEAQGVIDGLYQIWEKYGNATVGHLNNLLGEPPQYTDHNFGWTDLTDLTARRVHGGFRIILPPVENLN